MTTAACISTLLGQSGSLEFQKGAWMPDHFNTAVHALSTSKMLGRSDVPQERWRRDRAPNKEVSQVTNTPRTTLHSQHHVNSSGMRVEQCVLQHSCRSLQELSRINQCGILSGQLLICRRALQSRITSTQCCQQQACAIITWQSRLMHSHIVFPGAQNSSTCLNSQATAGPTLPARPPMHTNMWAETHNGHVRNSSAVAVLTPCTASACTHSYKHANSRHI
jgi:hypothetical protein